MNNKEMFDVAVIGLGPAGYTAALYTARYKLKTLQIGKEPGGLMSEAPKVRNFPSYPNISGMDLAMKMEEHVKDTGVDVFYGEVKDLKGKDLDFTVKTTRGNYKAKKIILATGQERRKLGLNREEDFTGRGVSYCATCDANFYDDQIVGVVGGGDAALASALLLADHAEKVYILYRRGEFFRPEPIRIEQVKKNDKIETIFEVNVEKLIGNKTLEAVKLDNGKKLRIDGLFIEVGSVPNTDLAKQQGIDLTENGYIITDERGRTNVPGIYAAGDVTDSPLKQIVTAAGQAAKAANTAYEELKRQTMEREKG